VGKNILIEAAVGSYTFNSDTNQICSLILKVDDLITQLGQAVCELERKRGRDFKRTLF